MSGQVYSSKSLLETIGKNNTQDDAKDTPNDENVALDADSIDDGDTFLLASTIGKSTKVDFFTGTSASNVNRAETDSSRNPSPILDTGNYAAADTEETETKSDTGSVASSSNSDIFITNSSDPKILNKSRSKTLDILNVLNPSNLLPSHDLLLGAYLEEHKYELLHNKTLIMRVVTWNLNQMKPPSLKELAGEDGKEWAALFYAGDETVSEDNKEGLADIYTINLQETISLKSFSKSDMAIDVWVHFILAVLNAISPKEYSLVFKTGLLGLTTIIIAKKSLLPDPTHYQEGQLHDVREDHIGLGYLRWANKGCISVKFRVGGVDLGIGKLKELLSKETFNNNHAYNLSDLDDSIGKLPGVEVQILNVHLVHGEGEAQVQQRWDSWSKIAKKIPINDRSIRLAVDFTDKPPKDPVQRRLEEKLKSKLLRERKISNGGGLDEDIEKLSLSLDVVRTSHVPLKISEVERRKMVGLITENDLQKIEHISESQKAFLVSGDTNYRLNLPLNISSNETVKELAKDGRWKDIVSHDQLIEELRKGKILEGLSEPDIAFAPTFKIINGSNGQWVLPKTLSDMEKKRYRKPVPGTSPEKNPHYVPRYDSKRIPAYTDRILYAPRPHFAYINNTYSSVSTKGSDHLPVTCTFALDAPLVDEEKLHLLKVNFSKRWDELINKLVFMELASTVEITHSFMGKKEEYETRKSVSETVPSNKGNISVSAIVGETITITLGVQNIIDESFVIHVKEQSSRGWFGTKISIGCMENSSDNSSDNSSPFVAIGSGVKGTVSFQLTPSISEVLERTFSIEISEYSLCPAYRKYVALNIKVYDFFGTSLDSLNNFQFQSVHSCFQFICSNSSVGLLDHIKELSSPDDFLSIHWDLVREITLWKFDPAKYSDYNDKGLAKMKEGDSSKFNLGSKTVITVLYIWLKSQGSHFNTSTTNGKIIFGDVINLIKYFKMDSTEAYDCFGWLFADEYELDGYLERDFDVKISLNS